MRRKLGFVAFVSAAMLASSSVRADEKEKSTDNKSVHMIGVSQLIGANVVNENNETIASVDDIVVFHDMKAGFFILGHGGVLGIGEEHIAVPAQNMKVTVQKNEDGSRKCHVALLKYTASQLDQAPRLKSDGYDELRDKAWLTRNSEFFGTDTITVEKTKGFLLANSILAADLYNPKGEKLAAIDYLIYCTQERAIKYLLIDHETTITDDKLVAVPAHSIAWAMDQDHALNPQLNATVTQLNAAPRVDVENLTQFEDKKFSETIDKMFPALSNRSVSAN